MHPTRPGTAATLSAGETSHEKAPGVVVGAAVGQPGVGTRSIRTPPIKPFVIAGRFLMRTPSSDAHPSSFERRNRDECPPPRGGA